jgi:hypothetical protein
MTITRDHLHDEVVNPNDPLASQTDGGDIEFSSDEAGTNRIACEIVAWGHDTGGGYNDAAIEAHVLVPSVSSSTDTDIWIWYNTSGTSSQPAVGADYGRNAVWSGYHMVFHGEVNTTLTDSTGNGNDGTLVGTAAETATAKLAGKAITLDGNSDYVDISTGTPAVYTAETIASNGLSMMAWVKTDLVQDNANHWIYSAKEATSHASATAGGIFVKDGSGWGQAWAVVYTDAYHDPGNNHDITVALPDDDWYMHSAVVDITSNEIRVYSDATQRDSEGLTTTDPPFDATYVRIGARPSSQNDQFLNGEIDELRVYDGMWSDAEMSATYSNQNAPAAFATVTEPVNTDGTIKVERVFVDALLNTSGTENSGYGGFALTATTSGTADTIHVSDSAAKDEIYIYCCNTNASDLDVTFQTSSAQLSPTVTEICTKTIPAKSGLIVAIPGLILNGAYALEAYAPSNPGSINIFGYVNRIY